MATRNDDNNRGLMIYIWICSFIMAIIFCMLLSGCKTVEYVEVPVTHTEIEYRDRVDSIAVHDSVYIKEFQKGDTVKVVEYRYRDKFRYIYSTDTITQRDTVSVIHTEVVEKTVAKMNSLQSAFFWLGILTFLGIIAYVAYYILKKKYSFIKKE